MSRSLVIIRSESTTEVSVASRRIESNSAVHLAMVGQYAEMATIETAHGHRLCAWVLLRVLCSMILAYYIWPPQTGQLFLCTLCTT